MKDVIQEWYRRNFSDPQAVILALILLIGFAIVIYMGGILAPFLVGIVVAYLLEGLVTKLEARGIRRILVVLLVFGVFVLVMLVVVLGLVPLLLKQVTQLLKELPNMFAKGQELVLQLPQNYPNLVSETQVNDILFSIQSQLLAHGQDVFTQGLSSILPVLSLAIYMILVPFLVFFMLKDKDVILSWVRHYLPRQRGLATKVWQEMDLQIGNYVRGKIVEIFIVAFVSYIVFAIMGLQYSMLLAAVVGLSVLIPYIGAAVVTFPVLLVGYFQWGSSPEFWYLVIAYTVIQALDGNVLVPVLFSEAVNLHPLAIILAVLFFGGIWGVWGIFFAIPLATLVKAVLTSWPQVESDTSPPAPSQP